MSEPVTRLAALVASWPDVAALVVEATPELGATLVRYAANGEPAGDVWYGSAEEAQLCAARDYGGSLGEWRPLPPGAGSPLAFLREA